MKKEREDHPLDDLFARKLGNLSLPPSANGFDRLRSRMAQDKPMGKVVFWRNPALQRYMAAAACLVLVCLLSWLYWLTGSDSKNSSVAVHQSTHSPKAPNNQAEEVFDELAHQQRPTDSSNQGVSGEQSADTIEATKTDQQSTRLAESQPSEDKSVKHLRSALTNQVTPIVAQGRSVERESKREEPETVASANPSAPRLTESTAKPTSPAERVLVVTIDEPAVLVAARQEKPALDEKAVVAFEEKAVKEGKTGSLWQKMKQLKQGELLAKSDNPTDDEQGLLGRAYTGLKHSIEKNKTTKQ